MIVQCSNCESAFTVKDEKVQGKKFAFSCPNCSHNNIIDNRIPKEKPEEDDLLKTDSRDHEHSTHTEDQNNASDHSAEEAETPSFDEPLESDKMEMPSFDDAEEETDMELPSLDEPLESDKMEIPSFDDAEEESDMELPSFDGPLESDKMEMPSFDDAEEETDMELPSFDEPLESDKMEMPSFDNAEEESDMELPSFDEPLESDKMEMPSFDDAEEETDMDLPSFDEPLESDKMEMPSFDDAEEETGMELPSFDEPLNDIDLELPSLDEPDENSEKELPSSDEPDGETDIPAIDTPEEDAASELPSLDAPLDDMDLELPDFESPEDDKESDHISIEESNDDLPTFEEIDLPDIDTPVRESSTAADTEPTPEKSDKSPSIDQFLTDDEQFDLDENIPELGDIAGDELDLILNETPAKEVQDPDEEEFDDEITVDLDSLDIEFEDDSDNSEDSYTETEPSFKRKSMIIEEEIPLDSDMNEMFDEIINTDEDGIGIDDVDDFDIHVDDSKTVEAALPDEILLDDIELEEKIPPAFDDSDDITIDMESLDLELEEEDDDDIFASGDEDNNEESAPAADRQTEENGVDLLTDEEDLTILESTDDNTPIDLSGIDSDDDITIDLDSLDLDLDDEEFTHSEEAPKKAVAETMTRPSDEEMGDSEITIDLNSLDLELDEPEAVCSEGTALGEDGVCEDEDEAIRIDLNTLDMELEEQAPEQEDIFGGELDEEDESISIDLDSLDIDIEEETDIKSGEEEEDESRLSLSDAGITFDEIHTDHEEIPAIPLSHDKQDEPEDNEEDLHLTASEVNIDIESIDIEDESIDDIYHDEETISLAELEDDQLPEIDLDQYEESIIDSEEYDPMLDPDLDVDVDMEYEDNDERVLGPGYLNFSVDYALRYSRIRALLKLFGIYYITMIPHLLVYAVYSAASSVLFLVNSLVVLFTGKNEEDFIKMQEKTLRYGISISAVGTNITEAHPAFGGNGDINDQVQLNAHPPVKPSRVLAFMRATVLPITVILLPHIIITAILSCAVVLCNIVALFSVIFTGRWPGFLFDFMVRYYRYVSNINAFAIGLVDSYPSFRFE
jgi:predicted Zn finger-like uncharacterized protein